MICAEPRLQLWHGNETHVEIMSNQVPDIGLTISGLGAAATGVTASSRVYDDLRRKIIDLELPPDATISRGELTKVYGVSQMPVREALQLLEGDGLIRIFPQSKTVVARIDEQQLQETQFLRVSLETEVVRRLAADPNPALVKRVRSIVRMQESLAGDTTQMALFNDLDRAFHTTLFEALNLKGLHRMLVRRLGHLARCQRLELPRQGKMEQIVQAHHEIIDGIEAGDPNAADAAMRAHISGTIQRISQLRAEFPDYFDN